jgi:predicted glycosyltransferase involved in capsule biosynthesis
MEKIKKYNLIDCSVIIPVQIDSQERLEHVHFLLRYFMKFFTNFELIVVEQGIEPRIKIPSRKGVRIEFLRNEEELFSPSKICNIGASFVKTSFFCKCDTDVFIHPRAIFDAFEKLKTNPHVSLVLPYNGVSFTLKTPCREELMSSFRFDSLPFVKPEESMEFASPSIHLKSNDSMGLIHHFRTSVFKELGGYNEEFIGWGYEDGEILTRFGLLGHPRTLLENYNAFHLDHPRFAGCQFHLLKNMYLLDSVARMSKDQLIEYIKCWSPFPS